jgi:uncharacterized glyoxalase superfamily protein PhnB
MSEASATPPTVFPALRYADGPAAVDWLRRVFGFEEHAVHRTPDGAVGHAEMKIGNGMIMFGSAGEADPANPWTTAAMGVYVCVDDVDAHHARAVANGADIVRDLADTDYGSREYSARDLDGNLWSFGSYQPFGG